MPGNGAGQSTPAQGPALDPQYLDYFHCFNQQCFFEAHEVLESLWLPQRDGPNGPFYKGLIQLAGAFVHLQKNRFAPAHALLRLAHANLAKYPAIHLQCDVQQVLDLIELWLAKARAADQAGNPLQTGTAPKLCLQDSATPPVRPSDTPPSP